MSVALQFGTVCRHEGLLTCDVLAAEARSSGWTGLIREREAAATAALLEINAARRLARGVKPPGRARSRTRLPRCRRASFVPERASPGKS